MNIDLRPLVSPSYWLTMDPPSVWTGAGRSLIVVFAGMLLASVLVRRSKAARSADRHLAQVYRQVSSLLATMGTVGIALFFFSFQDIRLFGARFLYLLWMVGTAWWAVSIAVRAKRWLPEARRRDQERIERERYLPKRKN